MTLVATETVVNPLAKSKLYKKGLCDYVINIATGCLHGCTFCFVPATPVVRHRSQYLNDLGIADPQMDWGKYLFIRHEVPQQLDRLLTNKKTWEETPAGKGVVLVSSGTDPYQNTEVGRVTRQVVEILLKHNKRVRILTRSPLWVKDLDILTHKDVTVGMSLPHLDDFLSRKVEPNAPVPSARLRALQRGKEAGCRLYIAAAPTPPVHGFSEFSRLLKAVKPLEPEVCFWEPINARGTNGRRMIQAGLDWALTVMQAKSAAEVFARQFEEMSRAALEIGIPLHVWPDQALEKHLNFKVNHWFDQPTVERWSR